MIKLEVRVGFQRGAKQEADGTDLVDVAAYNELGTSRSPARPFIKESADKNKEQIQKFCKAQLQAVAKGKTAKQALNAIGGMQKSLMQDTISKSKDWAEPNAPLTIKLKSKSGKVGDQPLVNTSTMIQSVNYVIKPKGGDE